jgi:hypothetical protein
VTVLVASMPVVDDWASTAIALGVDGVGVTVGVLAGVGVGVNVGVGIGVAVAVRVGVGVKVGAAVGVGVGVLVAQPPGQDVGVGVGVDVAVGVAVGSPAKPWQVTAASVREVKIGPPDELKVAVPDPRCSGLVPLARQWKVRVPTDPVIFLAPK